MPRYRYPDKKAKQARCAGIAGTRVTVAQNPCARALTRPFICGRCGWRVAICAAWRFPALLMPAVWVAAIVCVSLYMSSLLAHARG